MFVLNDLLYFCLRERFHAVRVANPRQAALVYYRPDFVYRKGRKKACLSTWGETYYVNCPFCYDTRGRLGICHRWAVTDQETHDDMLQLATCFNEDCLNTRERQKQLYALVFPNGALARQVTVELPKFVKRPRPSRRHFELPEGVMVNALPPEHAAVRYLKRRGFSLERLAEEWGVVFCAGNDGVNSPPYFEDDRIVYPVHTLQSSVLDGDDVAPVGRLAGWQARRIDDRDQSEPKYYTAAGMRKSELLYGLPAAAAGEGPLVIVEGVTDVWRLRRDAVALFGKTISEPQVKLLCRHFAGRPLVVFLDADAREQARQIRRRLMAAREEREDDAPVVLARTPKGRSDPGECKYAEAWEAVDEALR